MNTYLCSCHSPLNETHASRFPTKKELSLLKSYFAHQEFPSKPHDKKRQNNLAKKMQDYLVLVYENSLPGVPNVMNVYPTHNFDGEDAIHVFLCYEDFLARVPVLDLRYFTAYGEEDTHEASFKRYVQEGQGDFGDY